MKKEILTFAFEGGPIEIEVATVKGDNHIQITAGPVAPKLLDHYGTQVFHKFAGKPLQAAFPEESPETQDYYRALKHAVSKYAERWKNYA